MKIPGPNVSGGKPKLPVEKTDQMDTVLKRVKTPKELNHHRCFSPRLSYIAASLYNLVNVDKSKPKLTEKEKAGLGILIREIKNTPGLAFLNDDKIKVVEYYIYADASTTAMGGVIMVKTADCTKHPLCFHSKTFPDDYRMKHTNILETLAFNMMVRKFKGYICDCRPTFFTDSQYFKWVMEMKADKRELLPSNVLRWITEIKQEADPKEVVLIKSK